jgi:hypothetical protein
VKDFIDAVIEKIKALLAPAPVPVPIPVNRPRR